MCNSPIEIFNNLFHLKYLPTSQSCHIQNNVCLQVFVSIENTVGKNLQQIHLYFKSIWLKNIKTNQSAFCVRVIDLDCSTRIKSVDIVGSCRKRTNRIFRQAKYSVQIFLKASQHSLWFIWVQSKFLKIKNKNKINNNKFQPAEKRLESTLKRKKH